MKKILISTFIVLSVISFMVIESDVLAGKKCTMDVQCSGNKKCVEGVCVGGTVPKIKGKCIRGNFGKKVCSNTGDECSNDSQCWK